MNTLMLRDITIGLKRARKPLIGGLGLTTNAGEIVTVMGPSGVGKSTLLAYVGGHLDHAFSATGEVWIGTSDVTNLPPEQRRIGILFQDDLLFPHLSVGDNLAFGLKPAIRGSHARRARVAEALSVAGLPEFMDRDPATLSGGQRVRVALMRTLLSEPAALLLDEPFSKLDSGLRGEIRGFVFEHIRARMLPALMVSHDESDAQSAGGPVLQLQASAEGNKAGMPNWGR